MLHNNKLIFIWDPCFSEEENKAFQEFLNKLIKNYNGLLCALTVEEINKDSFEGVIVIIVFSNTACILLSEKITSIGLTDLPVVIIIGSQQNGLPFNSVFAFPSVKTTGALLAQAICKVSNNEPNKIFALFLPLETATISADAFRASLKLIYPNINPDVFVKINESKEQIISKIQNAIDSDTYVAIHGYGDEYNSLLNVVIQQEPMHIISDFNTPDNLIDTQNLSYLCFEIPLTGISLYKKISQILVDTIHSYINDICDELNLEKQRETLRSSLLNQSKFRKTPLGTFHFTYNNDFFSPFYLKYGGTDRLELIEGVETRVEIPIIALSECNKWLEEFIHSSEKNAFVNCLHNITNILKDHLFCNDLIILSRKINQFYEYKTNDWDFMLGLPDLFDKEMFWTDNNKNASVKTIQISLNKPDLEDFSSYRLYVNGKEPFINYLHFNKSKISALNIAKCIEEKGISNVSEKEYDLLLLIDKLKSKCFYIQNNSIEYDYIYFVYLRQKEEEKSSYNQHVCYCFCTKMKLGVFELSILENIFTAINHTLFEVMYKRNLQKESVKSAISAIMARNMSHNLGSHFISNTKNYFNNLAEKETLRTDESKQRQKDYRGIRHTLQYIQERMDFIATIVSTDRFPYGPVNVKSQIFDELTPDEFGKRHEKATTNFLLDYMVFSEDISKQSNISKSGIKLSLNLISGNGNEFGGQEHENQEVKEEFAKLNLAVPGGILGRHAIFTIIENVIRNSAKHDKDSIPKDGLNVAIKIGKDHGYIVIFDNKKNANKRIDGVALKDELKKRYTKIKILSDGAIDKSNKGLKEILISALWLNNHSLADWFGEYEGIPSKDKIEKLSEVLRVVTVDDNGDITDEGENLGYYIALDKYEEIYTIPDDIVVDDKIQYSNISGIKADIIVANKDYEVLIDENISQNGDASTNSNNILRLSDLYPRFYENTGGGQLPQTEDMMKTIIARNTGMAIEDLEQIEIHIEPKDYNLLSDTSKAEHCIWHATGETTGIKQNDILFKNHLSVQKTEEIDRVLAAYGGAAYIDSISGGDFTGTITQPFFLSNGFNRLKVIESALTELVVIDERVFKNYGHGFKIVDGSVDLESNMLILESDEIFNTVEELLSSGKSIDDITDDIHNRYGITLQTSLLNSGNKDQIREDIDRKITKKKNTATTEEEKVESNSDNISALHKMIEKRKLYIYDIDKNGNILNLESENVANVIDCNNTRGLCAPTFVSIHLSIIEKIIKENNGVRASQVMANLKKLFGNTKFVTIHSGRGNLSAELEKELKDYAFLSLSAIQAAMDDSKYFLSQLLYNNCYIGKGRLNHK